MRIATYVTVVAALAFALVSAQNVFFYDEQRVDHFDFQNTDTWSQRVNVTDTWYKPGGPVFLFLAGEAPMQFFEFQEVQAHAWAEQHNALYIVLEHRFYGESLPINDSTPYSTANLQYLTSQQALGDAAQFITWYNSTQMEETGPWIIIGCSYSAGLAAWFRAKYPDLVIGALAPSGPVQATLDQYSYAQEWSSAAPADCVTATATASKIIQNMTTTAEGRANLSTIFDTCAPLQEEDVYWFLWNVMLALAGDDQFGSNPPSYELWAACDMLNATTDYVGNWGKLFQQANGGCFDAVEADFITAMQNESSQQRSWYYQKCNEFGYFKTSYSNTSVFFTNLGISHLVNWCSEIYGIKDMSPHTEWTNTYYGGYNLQASNVLFTNGLLDPWHLLSIYEDVPAPSQVKAVTYEAGHCATLIQSYESDPPSLVEARAVVNTTLSGWLSDYYESH